MIGALWEGGAARQGIAAVALLCRLRFTAQRPLQQPLASAGREMSTVGGVFYAGWEGALPLFASMLEMKKRPRALQGPACAPLCSQRYLLPLVVCADLSLSVQLHA
jgi:hypothetical protein